MSMLVQPGRFGGGGGGGTDPHFANVVFLSGFDGTDGATSATDDSVSAHTINFSSNAQLDTAVKKFGSASLMFPDTTGLLKVPNSSDFQFGSGQFTVEAFLRPNMTVSSNANHGVIALFDTNSQRSWGLMIGENAGGTKQVRWIYSTDGTGSTTIGADPNTALGTTAGWNTSSPGDFFHFAVDRDGSNQFRMYVNGTTVLSQALAVTLFGATADLSIGSLLSSGAVSNGLTCWVDEVRITKGVARYASDSGLTVPTAAFPRS